jgi:hypothetical protein
MYVCTDEGTISWGSDAGANVLVGHAFGAMHESADHDPQASEVTAALEEGRNKNCMGEILFFLAETRTRPDCSIPLRIYKLQNFDQPNTTYYTSCSHHFSAPAKVQLGHARVMIARLVIVILPSIQMQMLDLGAFAQPFANKHVVQGL